MAALGAHYGEPVRSSELAASVNAEPTFIRRVISKLSKAGLVTTVRGKNGACMLARPPESITLLDIYKASEAPATFAVHAYPVTDSCRVSRNIKGCMKDVLEQAQADFEQSLAKRSLADLVAVIGRGG